MKLVLVLVFVLAVHKGFLTTCAGRPCSHRSFPSTFCPRVLACSRRRVTASIHVHKNNRGAHECHPSQHNLTTKKRYPGKKSKTIEPPPPGLKPVIFSIPLRGVLPDGISEILRDRWKTCRNLG